MAETMIGRGDKAYEYYRVICHRLTTTKLKSARGAYVYAQSTSSRYSPRFGQSRNPWLSGTTAWAYYTAAQYILGIRPQYNGLMIDPCIPASWEGFSVQRVFRGKKVNVKVTNNAKVTKGVKSVTLNGEVLTGNILPFEKLKAENEVLVSMG
jgi:cellobiose phosphorylase